MRHRGQKQFYMRSNGWIKWYVNRTKYRLAEWGTICLNLQ